ncbi:MAG: hypothetical protein NTU91_10985 [Chloroflexi bacterium]|nr:hypothetical protein [Chloroflexota bacterium]
MTLPHVIGELVPAAFIDLVRQVREKYQIPDPGPDGDFRELLAQDLPYEQIRIDLCEGLREMMPEGHPLAPFLTPLLHLPADLPLSTALTDLAAKMPADWTVGNTLHKTINGFLEPHIQKLADILLAYMLTGETKVAPGEWFGGAFVLPVPGQPMVAVLASEYSDLGLLVNDFRRKYHETFPQRHRRLDRSAVNAAEALRLKLEGYRLKDIADVYIARHPSEFPRDPLSPRYRAAKKQLEERIKKQIGRLRAALCLDGDT